MTFSGKLYSYQEEDADYILERGNLMLAYGQGCGKTIMTIAAVEKAMDSGLVVEPGLIVCLSPLKDQWAQAIHKWTGGHQERDKRSGLLRWVGGSSTPLVIDGPPAKRLEQYKQARNWEEPGGADYIILSYEQVVNDWRNVRRLPRGFVVLDESTFIKGFTSKRAKAVKRLGDAPIRVALTGTPMDNAKLEEIFSQMQFVDEDVLGRWDVFDQTFIERNPFGWVRKYRNIPLFRETIGVAFRRRTRHDPEVAPFFPDVIEEETPLVATLDPKTRKLYKMIAAGLVADLKEAQQTHGSFDLGTLYGHATADGDSIQGRIAQKRMALQMLIDHPELLRISARKFEAFMEGGKPGGSAYVAGLVAEGLVPESLKTPKMDRAVRYVKEALDAEPANKVVIFATYVDTLPLFQQRLDVGSVLFHGGMSNRQKAAAMDTFKQDPDCRVFLSSDAGGYGIDLPEANYLLNYSFPEKWGTSDQRETRIIRAGSGWDEVYVRRITVAGSIDVMKYNRLVMKGKVSEAFLDGRGITAKGGLANDVGSLLTFLTEEAGELAVPRSELVA